MKERFIFDGTQQQLIEMCKEKDLLQYTLVAKWDDFEIYFNKIDGIFQSNRSKWCDICCYYLPEGVERPYGQDTLNDVEDILLKMGVDTEFIEKLIDLLNGIPDIEPVYTEDEFLDKLRTYADNILGFDILKFEQTIQEGNTRRIDDTNEYKIYK